MALATSSSSLCSVTPTRPQATHKNNGIAFSASWSIQHVMCACPMQLRLGSTHNNPFRIADMVNPSLTQFNERFCARIFANRYPPRSMRSSSPQAPCTKTIGPALKPYCIPLVETAASLSPGGLPPKTDSDPYLIIDAAIFYAPATDHEHRLLGPDQFRYGSFRRQYPKSGCEGSNGCAGDENSTID